MATIPTRPITANLALPLLLVVLVSLAQVSALVCREGISWSAVNAASTFLSMGKGGVAGTGEGAGGAPTRPSLSSRLQVSSQQPAPSGFKNPMAGRSARSKMMGAAAGPGPLGAASVSPNKTKLAPIEFSGPSGLTKSFMRKENPKAPVAQDPSLRTDAADDLYEDVSFQSQVSQPENDLNPFVFLDMLRAQDMPSKEFVYLNMVQSDKYNPYNLEIVPYR